MKNSGEKDGSLTKLYSMVCPRSEVVSTVFTVTAEPVFNAFRAMASAMGTCQYNNTVYKDKSIVPVQISK